MKTLVLALSVVFAGTAIAQLAPQASPSGKVEQRIGLTDVTVKYSRPSKNNRVIFGDLVPFGEVWRTGANENTTITCTDALIFGKDSLKPGTYALYSKPAKDSWELIFYSTTDNWGTPEKWDDSKVVLRTKAAPVSTKWTTESFTINITNLKNESAAIQLMWDETAVSFPFTVPTDSKVMANIDKAMAGPTGNEYYAAANYYFESGKDLKKANEWCAKAIAAEPDAFWIYLLMAKIQVKQGLKKEALATAEKGRALAVTADYQPYVKQFDTLIADTKK